jgi:hypothetical protein
MGKRQAYCQKMDATLRDWNALFDELRAEVASQTTRVRYRYQRCAADFQPRREVAEQQLAALRQADGEGWQKLKPALEDTLEELRGLVRGAKITDR